MRTFFLVLLLILSPAFANSLWKVEGDKTFYLFGTIHLLKPSAFPLPFVYGEAMAQCDSLYLELDEAELTNTNTLITLQQLMQLPAGTTLKETLSASDYTRLEELAQVAGVNLAPLQGYKLWFVVNQLTAQIFQQQGFLDTGLDVYLHQWALDKDIRVEALESYLFQMQMFEDMVAQSTEDYLTFSLDDLENADTLIESLYSNWAAGNYQTLYEESGFDGYPEIEQMMLTDRNSRWMQILKATPKDETTCVAVGLLHMAADHGLISQFEKAGYKVSQLK